MENWIRRQLFTITDEGPCLRFVLKHITSGKKASEVLSLPVPEQAGSDFVTELINELEATAVSDAGGVGGVQSYIIQSFFTKSKTRPGARFTFRVQGENEEDIDGEFSSEPPTLRGQLSQTQRHLEAVMRTSTMNTGHVMAMMQRTINRLADQNEALADDKLKTLEVLESLHSQKHERDLETRKAAHREELVEKGFDKLGLLMPVVVNKLTGRKMLPETASSKEMMISAFLESLSPEQLDKISSTLEPEQMAAFAQAAQQFMAPEKPED